MVWHDGVGLSLYAKRLDRGRFVWPTAADGAVALSAGQLAICSKESTGEIRNRPGGRRALDKAKKLALGLHFRAPQAADFMISLRLMDAALEALPDDVAALKAAL